MAGLASAVLEIGRSGKKSHPIVYCCFTVIVQHCTEVIGSIIIIIRIPLYPIFPIPNFLM